MKSAQHAVRVKDSLLHVILKKSRPRRACIISSVDVHVTSRLLNIETRQEEKKKERSERSFEEKKKKKIEIYEERTKERSHTQGDLYAKTLRWMSVWSMKV